jgi:hypothetical protein
MTTKESIEKKLPFHVFEHLKNFLPDEDYNNVLFTSKPKVPYECRVVLSDIIFKLNIYDPNMMSSLSVISGFGPLSELKFAKNRLCTKGNNDEVVLNATIDALLKLKSHLVENNFLDVSPQRIWFRELESKNNFILFILEDGRLQLSKMTAKGNKTYFLKDKGKHSSEQFELAGPLVSMIRHGVKVKIIFESGEWDDRIELECNVDFRMIPESEMDKLKASQSSSSTSSSSPSPSPSSSSTSPSQSSPSPSSSSKSSSSPPPHKKRRKMFGDLF